jgi:hypothetical protein
MAYAIQPLGYLFKLPGITVQTMVIAVNQLLGFGLRSPDHLMSRSPDSVALCLRPSARPHPGVALLLKTKAKVTFERTVKSLSKLFLDFFLGSNLA